MTNQNMTSGIVSLMEEKDKLMEDIYRMRLLVNAAVQFFEDEGDEIIRFLQKEQKNGLVRGMDTLGVALYWMRRHAETLIADREEERV